MPCAQKQCNRGFCMLKNITLSADEELIRKARRKAQKENTTVNEQFRIWLSRFINADNRLVDYDALMKKLSYASSGKKFTREELNER